MRSFFRTGLALGLVLAACKDDPVAPRSLADPQATMDQLAALDDVFNSQVLTSFTALSGSGSIAPPAAAPFAALRSAVRTSNPLDRSSMLRPYGRNIERAQALRHVVPTLASAVIIPPEQRGTTFEWNTTNDLYEPTARTGAPAQGVRFILYAIDPLTIQPVEPLVEVGYVDLLDNSTDTKAELRIVVAGVGGTPVYVDYTVTITSTGETSGRIAAGGYITNGASSPDTLRFNGVLDVTSTTLVQDVSLDVNSQDIHIRSVERLTITDTSITVRIDFRLEYGTEIVTLVARFTSDLAGTGEGTVTVSVDGGPFATCTAEFSPGRATITCEGADADGLNAEEEAALQAIVDAVAKVGEIFLGIFSPAEA